MKRKPIKPPGTNSTNVDSAQKGFDGVPLNGNGYDMQQQYLQPQQHQFPNQFFPQQQQQSYQYPQQQQFDQQPFYQQVRVIYLKIYTNSSKTNSAKKFLLLFLATIFLWQLNGLQ